MNPITAHYKIIVAEYQYNIITQVDEFSFETTRDIDIKLSNGERIFVPKNYETDLASVPRALWAIIPPFGEYTFAAVIHDYLYDNGLYTKAFADKEFKHIMRASKVVLSKRILMYLAVKFFGHGNY